MELDKAIQSRYSCRKFSSKKPDWRDIIEAIDGARYAPMAGNNFSLRFTIVDDKEKINKLAEAAQQDFVSQAKYVVVVTTEPGRTLNAFEERGKIYFRQQAGAAIQNFLLKLEEKKLATCWVGHLDEAEVKRAIKAPEGTIVEAIFPIGYDYKKSPTKRMNIELDRILYFNDYKNKKMQHIKTLGT